MYGFNISPFLIGSEAEKGISFLSVDYILKNMESAEGSSFKLIASYLEIYKNQVYWISFAREKIQTNHTQFFTEGGLENGLKTQNGLVCLKREWQKLAASTNLSLPLKSSSMKLLPELNHRSEVKSLL